VVDFRKTPGDEKKGRGDTFLRELGQIPSSAPSAGKKDGPDRNKDNVFLRLLAGLPDVSEQTPPPPPTPAPPAASKKAELRRPSKPSDPTDGPPPTTQLKTLASAFMAPADSEGDESAERQTSEQDASRAKKIDTELLGIFHEEGEEPPGAEPAGAAPTPSVPVKKKEGKAGIPSNLNQQLAGIFHAQGLADRGEPASADTETESYGPGADAPSPPAPPEPEPEKGEADERMYPKSKDAQSLPNFVSKLLTDIDGIFTDGQGQPHEAKGVPPSAKPDETVDEGA
jgi:hypothetical protein